MLVNLLIRGRVLTEFARRKNVTAMTSFTKWAVRTVSLATQATRYVRE